MDTHIDTVRDIYPEGPSIAPDSSHYKASHIHLCVRSSRMIGQIELVGTMVAPLRGV
jgi:hypothetical protein